MRVVRVALCCSALALLTGASVYAADAAPSKILRLDPRTMRQIAKVDPRFLSYTVEMVEVTGGVF